MRARHRQHVAADQNVLAQPLGAAGVACSRVQNGFHQRKLGATVLQSGATDHVAHYEHIGCERHLVGRKTFDQIDTERAQLFAHGRIDACVAARYAVAGLARECGQAAHEGAADAENVNVHGSNFSCSCGGADGTKLNEIGFQRLCSKRLQLFF